MARETLEMSSRLQKEKKVKGPGILYRVDVGGGSFCLRGLACPDLSFTLKQLEGEDPALLRLLRPEAGSAIHAFPVPYPALAEVVVTQLFNRRFPLEEESLCNLGSPGFNWWLEQGENRLRVFFSGHHPGDDIESLTKLGPIGDTAVAPLVLAHLQTTLAESFSLNDKFFSLSVPHPANPFFAGIQTLFVQGEWLFQEADFSSPTLALYLREMAETRRFWIEVEGLLDI